MTSYAALLSLFHTLNQIKNHPRPPIYLDQKQVGSLLENIALLQNFLERYPSSNIEEDNDLERRIAAAAYAAEDAIESHIVDQIHAGSTSHGQNISSVDFHGDLERLIKDMDSIKKEVEIIEEKITEHPTLSSPAASVGPASMGQNRTLVSFDVDLINDVLDKLTGQPCDRQVIAIAGMGGIGKTTFTRNIYSDQLIVHHFDICVWVTISQEYSREHVLRFLCQEAIGCTNNLSEMSEEILGQMLHKHLWCRRYLIVMDDIWSIGAWDIVRYFPENKNGSRIMITTRLSSLAFELSCSRVFRIKFLDVDKSWDLLYQVVFGETDCPLELRDIGKEIARNCRGLPMSIVVIGGLLKKSIMTRTYWEYTLQNLNSLINLEDNEYCLQILRTSYKELPIHLKPCFLYMGVFPEDVLIHVSHIIKLWVVEGILRQIDNKSLEEAAEVYLKELISRNLILVPEFRWNGEAKSCKIHDLLRDVSLREAKKENFLSVIRQQKHHPPKGINTERRICINHVNSNKEYFPQFLHALESASLTRTLLYTFHGYRFIASPSLHLGLLRVYSPVDKYKSTTTHSDNAIFEQANFRYLSLKLNLDSFSRLPNLFSLLWNLQIFKVDKLYTSKPIVAPSEIWEMPLLRHVMLKKILLPDPPDGEDSLVLENLQTLSHITNFNASEVVVKRIPNIKRLKVKYERAGDMCLNNLGCLHKLESLNLEVGSVGYYDQENVPRNLVNVPNSLKKLSLTGTKLSWDDLTIRVGALPLLQRLKLGIRACHGPKWETVEGQFCNLKLLHIEGGFNLKYWETDSTHFPRLEHLLLQNVPTLPLSIGDIPTLKSIRLESCSTSATDSAERIKEEQDENGNDKLQVVINSVML